MTDLDERAATNDYARHLLARFEELKQNKKRGRKHANDLQRLHEDAIHLLLDLRLPSAVPSLFSALLGDIILKSGDLDNRHAAELAAARLEAQHEGDKPLSASQVATVFACGLLRIVGY